MIFIMNKNNKKTLNWILISFFSIVTLCLTGCSESPLESLRDDQMSLRYSESFWSQQQKAHSLLWQQAIKFCDNAIYATKPNCGNIHDIQLFDHPTPYPKYGTGQGFGQMPVITH